MSHDPTCSCGHPGLTYDGPQVDCDVHGLPSAAFEAGRRVGAQDERDQQRIRGDLCRWCHRQPQPQLGERHAVPQLAWDGDVGELVCLGETGRRLAFGYGDVPESF